jgi:hypothetical protein
VAGVPLLLGPWLAGRRARSALASAEIHAHVEPGTVEVGGEMHVLLSVTHRVRRGASLPPLGLVPIDRQWQARGADAGPGRLGHRGRLAPSTPSLMALPTPAPGRTEARLIPVPTDRRGVFVLPPQPTWTSDPFGLFAAAGPSTPGLLAVVHPVPALPHGSLPELMASLGGAGEMGLVPSGGAIGDLEGIRPYVAGDRLSLLHWPARARYGSWFVRQFGTEGSVAAAIVIDDRAGVHRQREFEQLVAAALWILTRATGEGRSAHLLTLSGRQYLFGPGERGAAEARLVLAELQPAGSVTSTRYPSVPRDTVLLTTRTGADRMTPAGIPAPASVGTGTAGVLPGARMVVV